MLEASELNGAGVLETHGSEISGDADPDSMDWATTCGLAWEAEEEEGVGMALGGVRVFCCWHSQNEAPTKKMDPKGNGDTNASALRIGWLAGSRRNGTKRSMNFQEIMGRKMGI